MSNANELERGKALPVEGEILAAMEIDCSDWIASGQGATWVRGPAIPADGEMPSALEVSMTDRLADVVLSLLGLIGNPSTANRTAGLQASLIVDDQIQTDLQGFKNGNLHPVISSEIFGRKARQRAGVMVDALIGDTAGANAPAFSDVNFSLERLLREVAREALVAEMADYLQPDTISLIRRANLLSRAICVKGAERLPVLQV